MNRLKIADSIKGFTVLDDDPIEGVLERVVRSLTVPILVPVETVVRKLSEHERGISGCTDTGIALAEGDDLRDCAHELTLALGVSRKGIRWRWTDGSLSPVDWPIHYVFLILAPDVGTRLRSLREIAHIGLQTELGKALLEVRSLDEAARTIRSFETPGVGGPGHG